MAKKQRKLEREASWKQDIFDWRERVKMMIKHAESAFVARNWESAERYFSRLLSFLLENEHDISILLNERKRSNLKVHRRWKGVFKDHYLLPMAKMLCRRAYCLCSLPVDCRPRAAPPNNAVYCTMAGHLELAVEDLTVATSLRQLSPAYQAVVEQCDSLGAGCAPPTADKLCDLMQCQLCDLLSLGGLHDLRDGFEGAYAATLQADHLVHALSKLNVDLTLSLGDIVPLAAIQPVIRAELEAKRRGKLQKMEQEPAQNGLSVLEEMKETDEYPLRRTVDLSGYGAFDGAQHDVASLRGAIDEQLKTIRLCMCMLSALYPTRER